MGQQVLATRPCEHVEGTSCNELSCAMADVNNIIVAKYAGTLLDPPKEDSLWDAGVLNYGSEDKGKDLHNDIKPKNLAVQIDVLMSKLESNEVRSSSQPPVTIGTELPALSKKLIARVLANEYIDFSEVPPAKGKGRPMPQSLEGQVIVVQVAKLLQTRKIIPDIMEFFWVLILIKSYCSTCLLDD